MSYAVGGSGFLNNLGRIYAIYTGTFAAFTFREDRQHILIGERFVARVF